MISFQFVIGYGSGVSTLDVFINVAFILEHYF